MYFPTMSASGYARNITMKATIGVFIASATS